MSAESNVALRALNGLKPRTLEALELLTGLLADGRWHSLAECVDVMSATGMSRGYLRAVAADAYTAGLIERRGRKHRRHYAQAGTPWPMP